jgi:hypothetical protein
MRSPFQPANRLTWKVLSFAVVVIQTTIGVEGSPVPRERSVSPVTSLSLMLRSAMTQIMLSLFFP